MKTIVLLLFNPLFWAIIIIASMILGIWLKSKRRQRDIQKGVEKALKELEKEKTNH